MGTPNFLFTVISLLLMSVGISRPVSEGTEVTVLLTDGSKRVGTLAHVGSKEITLNSMRARNKIDLLHEVVPIESVKTVVIEGTSYGFLGSIIGCSAGLAVGGAIAYKNQERDNPLPGLLSVALGCAAGSGLGCEVGKTLSRDDRVFDPMVLGDMDSLKTHALYRGDEPELQERVK